MSATIERTPRVSCAALHRVVRAETEPSLVRVPVLLDGEVSGHATFQVLPGGLSVVWTSPAGVEQHVALAHVACTLGGYRTWFICAGCGARRAHLYVRGDRLACRGCADLVYAGQRFHRSLGYELRARPRRALQKIDVRRSRTRSPVVLQLLADREAQMLGLLQRGLDHTRVQLARVQRRVCRNGG